MPRSRSSCSPTSRRTEEDPKETTTADNELLELARRYGLEREDGIPIGFGRGEDHSNPVISVNHDACILCDRCVRACDDIQGNDVIGRSGQGLHGAHRLRPERPDGRVLLRDLRRMRGGLPHGRARQQAHPGRAHPAARRARLRGHGLPLLRRRLRAHLPRRPGAERDLVRRGPRAARLPPAPVREGPLRLGLREVAAAADHAAHPPRGVVPQGAAVLGCARRGSRAAQARRHRQLRRGASAFPGGQLGRGSRSRRRAPAGDPRRARPGLDRRLRLGQSARTRRPTSSRS